MKRLRSLAIIFAVSCISLIGLSSCGDDITQINGTMSHTQSYKINRENWKWNSSEGRYEYFISMSQLDSYIYNNGQILVSVFQKPGSTDEYQQFLPFSVSYGVTNSSNQYYTYTLQYTYAATVGQVALFIQPNDLNGYDEDIPSQMEFKISLLWDER